MAKKKSSLSINLEYFGLLLFTAIMDVVPIKLAYFLSNIIAWFVFIFDRKHRNRTIQHLQHAGLAKTEKEARQMAYENFKCLGQIGVDAFKVNRKITPENAAKYIEVTGSEGAIKWAIEGHKPVIALTAHMGNFVFIATAYAIFSKCKILSVIRPYDNPKVEKFIQNFQLQAGHECCHQEGALRPLMSALRHDKSIGLLVDQHAGGSAGIETQFFGQPAQTYTTPAVFHLKTKVPICLAVLRRKKDAPSKFELCFSDLITLEPTGDKEADIKNLTQLYTSATEDIIRETPEQWFWAHRRWTNINRKKRNRS